MTSSLPPFDILKRLDALTPDEGSQGKNQRSYFCPSCGAKNFKVDLRTGKYNGFGCDCMTTPVGRQAVIEAISPLEWTKPARHKQERCWTYRDVHGQPLVKVHRRDDGEGKRKIWQTALQPGEPAALKSRAYPYRFQQCLIAIEQGRDVFWVEGEPCADALWDIGIPATTTIGGTNNYSSEQYRDLFPEKTLVNGSLVICPDRDQQGLKYAEAIASDYSQASWCYVYPDSFCWQRLQKSGGADIADWIAEGASANTILAAVGEKRDFKQQSPEEPAQHSDVESKDKPNPFKRAYHHIEQLWGDRLRFNEYAKHIELDGQPIELGTVKVTLAVEENLNLGLDNLELILTHLAKRRTYHPVRVYLSECLAQHHDPNILNDLAQRYFGCTQPIYNTFLKRTLIAAVARIVEPGCKMDTALILQGTQGLKKSTFFKVLAGEDFFDDSLGAMSDKDERLKLHQTWFAEWAELESVFKRRDVAQTKAFLSSGIDVVRPPYGRQAERMKRQSIIVGTTNQEQFLSDATGNRRFWIVPVQRQVNLKLLAQERERIWGAAVALYRAGEQWWLTDEEEQQAQDLASNYQTSDPWESRIDAHLVEWRLTAVTTSELLTNCLEIEVGRQSRGDEMRVADCLKRLGWQSVRKVHAGKRRRVWVNAGRPKLPSSQPDGLPMNDEVDRSLTTDNTTETGVIAQPGQPKATNFVTTQIGQQEALLHRERADTNSAVSSNGLLTERRLE